MKTRTRRSTLSNLGLALLCLAAAFTLAVPATHAAPPATGDWSLVWSDEFNCGSTKEAPNPANWGFEYGYVRNSEDQKYTDSLKNAYCQNGLMNIEAHKEQDGTITSTSLVSYGKVSYKYGWIEMRGRIDTRLGSWPAFWSLGTQGQWPDSGESDIMEFYTGKLLFNAAWWKTGDGTWDARWDSEAVYISSLGSGWKDEFHVWAMEWTPDYVKYYMDGVLYNTWDSSQDNNGGGDTSTEGFQHPHYLLLNQAIGGTAGGDASGLAYPTTYEIDYVRWYQNDNPETLIDDPDASIAYSGTWGTYVGNGGYMNTEHYSETSGSTATFSFNGTQARYYGFKRNDLGKVNIYVDGAYVTTLDLYSSTFSGNYMLFETAVLASGSHTLTVELDGTQNSSSSGYEAIIDAFSWVDMGANPPALLEQTIMSWVAPYAIPESQAMAEADFGVCDPKDALTRVGLQFWTPNTNGTIKYANHEWYTPTDDDVAWWTEWGQTNGIKILLTIYNNNGSWDWNLARSAFANNRTTFVNALVSEMDRLNLDGIDIDLEGIGDFNGDRAAFDQFIHDLSVQVKARDKILTVDSFHYVWNAPNHDWWSDWLGEVDSIHSMGYDDLYEGGTGYQKYSFQQDAGYAAGYAGNAVLMGMPAWQNSHSSWGTSSGRGTSAQAHVQEVRYDLAEPTGIAIWDMQLLGWQDNSALWCEIAELKTETTTVTPPTPQSPYYGIPQTIPGQIEAEDFDLGDDGLAYHDCDAANQGGAYRASSGVDIEASTEGGYNVGWICTNEWLEYTVDVISAGTYNIEMRVASNTTGGAFHIEFDGVDKTGDISVPVTGGWQNWVSVTATVNLSAGVQVMRFANSNSASSEYNISYYSFSAAGGNAAPNANFSLSVASHTATFTDTSTDSDGSIASWSWNFGDGGTSTVQNPSYTYAVAGTYSVTLTVTDNDGASDTASLNVTVPSTPGGTKKSLVLMLDGLRSDGIINANTPNIDSLINGTFGGGAYRGAYAYAAQTIQDKPTSSAYNHVSIMTGVTGNKHGANDNNYAGIAAADYNTYPTYLSTLESDNSNLNTAFLVTWGADLGMVSGADYVFGQSDASNVDRAVNIINGTFSDASGDNGTSWSYGTDVDAITLFLDDIDGAGHANDYSPANANYIAEVESIDVQIGQILTAIQNRSSFASENWQIIITSDHGGFAGTHGNLDPNSETIPFIVASKSVSQGLLDGVVINYDTAATAIVHMLSAAAVPGNYDGFPQGDNVITPPPATLTDNLVVYLPFDSDYLDASGQGNDASIGAGSDNDPTAYTSGGKFGGYVEINNFGGGASNSSYLTLGNPADLDFGTDTHFTITTWFRAQASQAGDPVIMGNKSWADGFNKGVLLLGDESSNGDGFGVNISDGTSRRDIEPINYSFNEWWFQAISVDRNGNAVMFVGSPAGELYVISDFADDLGDITSSLPWNIGQDGTGAYAYNLDGDIDEMAIWRRALTLDEIQQLYNDGSGLDLQSLGNQAPVAGMSYSCIILDCSFTDDSSDSDGTIASRSWNFGDGTTSTSLNPSHTYAAAGTYTVTLLVTDNEDATNSTSSTVTVSEPPVPDTEAPTITAPADVTVEATGVTTTVDLGAPTVSDNVDPNPAVTNNALTAFPVGTTTVTWTATDASGNSASDTQTVTVTDTTAPSITAPGDVSVESSVPVAVALGTPTVSDLVDSSPTVINNAPALFPLGTTTVTWTATDTSGNSATDTQTVTVTAPVPNVLPTAAFSFSTTDLTADFTDTSSDSDGTISSHSWNFGDGNSSTATNPSHTYAVAGSYTVTLTVTDDDGDTGSDTTSISVTEPPPETDYFASGEIVSAGAVSGVYTATWADDADFQSITERESGGKKNSRYSYLEHTWQFNITAGASVTVYANAWSGGSTDGDNFLFEWSTSSSGGFQPLFSVDNSSGPGSTQLQLIDDTGLLSGTVYIRVRDTDRSAGNKTLDTVYVDQLYIESITAAGDPPLAPSSLAVSAPTGSSLTLNWADNSLDENSIRVERSTDGSTFSMLTTLAANTTNYIDAGLSGNTTYWYRVFASNASGSSAPSNVASGTTLVGSSITLTAKGYKVKGKQNVDLSWSGTAMAEGAEVDIYRDDMEVPLPATVDDGFYTDAIGNKGGGSYVYMVCEAGTGNCSDTVTVVF